MNITENEIKNSIKWFVDKIKQMRKQKTVDDEVDLKKQSSLKQFSKKMNIGYIYTHVYNPKFKEELPFYDVIPLWSPVKIMSDRIMGFNFHYLPPRYRKAFLDDYTEYLSKEAKRAGYKSLTELSPSQISLWGRDYMSDAYLRATKGPGNLLRACVRTYLYSHVQSKFLPVNITEWYNVYYLVLPKFMKKSDSYIYKEVIKEYQRYKDSIRRNIYR